MPGTVGLCTDEAVNERPFYVMEFVEGHILRSAPEAEAAFDEATRRAVGDHMADTLAALHDVDPDAVGLGDLGTARGLHRAAAQALALGSTTRCRSRASITAGWSSG